MLINNDYVIIFIMYQMNYATSWPRAAGTAVIIANPYKIIINSVICDRISCS